MSAALDTPPVTTVTLWAHQAEAVAFAAPRPAAMLAMDMGPQPLSAKVLTPSGWRSMGDLEVGDSVIAHDGLPVLVSEVHDYGESDVVRVTMSDGSSTRCTLDHLWEVRTPQWVSHRKRRGTGRVSEVLPIGALVERGLRDKQGNRLWFVPMVSPVELATHPYVIPPYTLGVLLGDGCLSCGVAWSKPEPQIASIIAAETTIPGLAIRSLENGTLFSITTARGQKNPYLDELRRLGLFPSRSRDKFIPDAYLWGAVEDRIAVLQGLLDTDGSCSPGKNTIEFSSVSRALVDGVLHLVQSLGGRGRIKFKDTYTGGAWRLHLGLPAGILPFRLERKAANYRPRTKYQPTRAIESVIPDGREAVRCIKVATDRGLYVTDDFIVTHNTGKSAVTIAIIGERGWQRTLILAPKSVVPHWPREFARFAAYPVRCVALDERKSVAERVAQAEAAARQPGPLVIVTNHEAAWRPAMSEWVTRWRPECCVVDEGHRAKDPFGSFSKWLGRMAVLFRQRLILTGTPAPHSPLDLFAQYRFLDARIFGHSFVRFRTRYGVMGGWQGKQVVGFQNTDELAEKYRSIAYECGADVVSLPETVDTTTTVQLGPKAARLYQQIARDFWAGVESGEITASNALTRMLRLQQITGGNVGLDLADGEDARDRRVERVDTAKRDALQQILEDLPANEPVVCFARFTADLAAVHEAAEAAGRTSAELSGRVNDLADWQAGEADVLAVQIQAGGVGIDLTRARVCVYYSLGFSLGEYLQSRKRTHRPGQTRSVLYVHLVAAGTIDEQVYRALERRQAVIESVLGGQL